MIIDKIKTYLAEQCPFVSTKGIAINSLGTKPQSFALEPTSDSVQIQKYPDGGSIMQCVFVLAMRVSCDSDPNEQQTAATVCEKIANWISDQNENGNLPTLGDGFEAVELKVLSGGYLQKAEKPTARYEIKLCLIYEKN